MAGSAAAELPPERDHRSTRRQQRIDAAIRSLAEHGLAPRTAGRAAGAAGLSQGIVTFSFGGKQALLEATPMAVDASGRFDLAGVKHTCRALLASVLPSRFSPIADPDTAASSRDT